MSVRLKLFVGLIVITWLVLWNVCLMLEE